MSVLFSTGRPRNEQRYPVERKVEPIPNAWAIPLQQTDAYRNNGARGRPQPQPPVDASTINKKSYTPNKNDTKPYEKAKRSDNPRQTKQAGDTTKPIDTTNLDDALKTLLRIGPTPANVSATAPVNVSGRAPATASVPSTSNPSSAEAEKSQSIDLNAIFQRAANGVPGFEQSPNVQHLPKPPANWHQEAKAAKRKEEVEQMEKELTPPPQLQPQPPFFMPPNQPPMAMFPPNFVPMIPLPSLNYAFPPNFYPHMMPPGVMPMMPGNFAVPMIPPQNLQQFAQFIGPPQEHVAQIEPSVNVVQTVPHADEPKMPAQSASVNAFIPLQAARKIAKDKATTKAAQNTGDKPKLPADVS